MHIILGVLGTAATLMFAIAALKRSGVDLGGLNPHALYRRVQWNRKAGSNPLYGLREPLDLVSVLLVGVAKCEGAITVSQKDKIIEILMTEFALDRDVADDQLVAATFMTRNEVYILDKLPAIVVNFMKQVTSEQQSLLLSMMQQVATVDGAPNIEQIKLIEATEEVLGR